MLRVILNANTLVTPGEGTVPDADTPSVALVNEAGLVVAEGQLVVDTAAVAQIGRIEASLRFVGKAVEV